MTDDMIEHKNAIEALHAVYQEVSYAQKTGTMQGGGARYTYVAEADLINTVRPSLVRHGLTLRITDTQLAVQEAYTTSRGAMMNRVIILATAEFAHVSGSTLTVSSPGEGADSGDKATAKAMTQALKYILRQSLVLETGDDPDATSSDDLVRTAPTQAPAAQPMRVDEPSTVAASAVVDDVMAYIPPTTIDGREWDILPVPSDFQCPRDGYCSDGENGNGPRLEQRFAGGGKNQGSMIVQCQHNSPDFGGRGYCNKEWRRDAWVGAANG